MSHRLQLAIVLSSVTLCACGGDSDTPGTATQAPAGPGATTPAASTTPTAETGDGGSSTASAARVPEACSVLSQRDLAVALRGRPPKGQADATGCTYEVRPRSISVAVARNAATGTTAKLLRARPHGSKVVRGGGLTAVLTTYVKPSSRAGSQVQVRFVKRGTTVDIRFTDATPGAGSIAGAAMRLARATARRL